MMTPIDLAGPPPTAAQIESEQRHLATLRQLYLLGGGNSVSLLALAWALANENGFDLFMTSAMAVLALAFVNFAHLWVLTYIRLDNLRPAGEGQAPFIESAMQLEAVARYMTNVHAQRRPLTLREAATLIVYAEQARRRPQTVSQHENEFSL